MENTMTKRAGLVRRFLVVLLTVTLAMGGIPAGASAMEAPDAPDALEVDEAALTEDEPLTQEQTEPIGKEDDPIVEVPSDVPVVDESPVEQASGADGEDLIDEKAPLEVAGESEGQRPLFPPKSPLPDDEPQFEAIGVDEDASARRHADEGTLSTQSTSEASLRSLILTSLASHKTGQIDVSSYGMKESEFVDFYSGIIDAHPELLEAKNGCRYWYSTADPTILGFEPLYTGITEDVQVMRKKLGAALAEVLTWVPMDGTTLQKVKAVHDWFCWNVEYDDAAYESDNYQWYDYHAYGALVMRSCVCSGYARAFKMVMDRLGIPCTCVHAHDHEWNRVKVGGSWYHVDCTWDENATNGAKETGTPFAGYFLKSDEGVQAQDKRYSSAYTQRGEITHGGYDATGEVPGTNTSYDAFTDDEWAVYRAPLSQNAVTDFTLTSSSFSLVTLAERKLDVATVVPAAANSRAAWWWSSNPGTAYVSPDGSVAAGPKQGTATITCTMGNIVRTCAVRVLASIAETTASVGSQTYTGKALAPVPTVTYGTTKLVKGTDFDVSYTNNVNVGTATATITGKGSFVGTKKVTFKITKAANPMTAKATKASVQVKYRAASSNVTARNVTLSGARGTVTYANASSNATAKKFSVNKTSGKVTVPKATKVGTYVVKVKVSATGNANYKAGSKVVSYKIVVAKAANPMVTKAVVRRVKYATIKKKNVTVVRPIAISKSQGKLSYAKIGKNSSKYLTVNKTTGKVTVKKGAKKCSHFIKIKVTAAGNANYKARSIIVTCKVEVK